MLNPKDPDKAASIRCRDCGLVHAHAEELLVHMAVAHDDAHPGELPWVDDEHRRCGWTDRELLER